jgi:hypothetical protein
MRAIRPSAASNGAALAATGEIRERRYVYCVYRSSHPKIFAGPGMAGRGFPVYALNYRNLAAVVSASPAARYPCTQHNMTTHMRVQEEVMRSHAILPAQFNTVSPNVESVIHRLLAPAYDDLCARLEDVSGRVEIGVKAFWRPDIVFHEIVSENHEIRTLRDAIAGRPPETSYHDRVLLGEMVEKALRLKRERECAVILERLKPHAEDLRLGATFGERAALNAVVFLKTDELPGFERSLNALQEELHERMLFKCVGPTPPYNFVELTLG